MKRRKILSVLSAALFALTLSGCAQVQTPTYGMTSPESGTSPAPSVVLPEGAFGDSASPAPSPSAAPSPSPSPASPSFDAAKLANMPHAEEYLALHESNPDVTGWLSVPNTVIDYAVALGDDNDYYLSHNLAGEESKSGALFFDFRTDACATARHLIIYGHNMKAGTMFHDLSNYKQKDFFDNNRRITLWVGDEQRVYEVYCAFVADTQETYFIRTDFVDDDDFLNYMNGLKDLSKFDTGVELTASDQILTLTTCSYEVADAELRFVVQARRVWEENA